MSRNIDDIRSTYRFDVSCQGSVPEALIAFLDTDDLETAVRTAVSLGGDADSHAAVAGAAAEAFARGVSSDVRNEVMSRLPADMIEVVREFEVRYSRQ